LANAGGPTRFAETRQIRIIRANGQVTRFNLQSYTEGTDNISVPDVAIGDAIFVPEKNNFNQKSWLKIPPQRAVQVIGEVHHPGRFEWSAEMTLFDLIAHAGGPNHKANIASIKVLSRNEHQQVTSTLFDLAKFIEQGGEMSSVPVIKATDVVVVPELPQDPTDNKAQWTRQPSSDSIYIMGEITTPGRYLFNQSLNFLDILTAAEGPNNNADIHNIRITHRKGPHTKVTRLDLGLYFQTGDENLLPKVQTGDVIYIPAKNQPWTDISKEQTVRVLGAINRQGRYRFEPSMTILDLLAQAGGFSVNAKTDAIIVVNNSCCAHGVSHFDLKAYAQSGDPQLLPSVATGDTIYVLSNQDSGWHQFIGAVQDTLSVLSILRILSGG
jgi:protein involved in polysaccharide export with SLBB domain